MRTIDISFRIEPGMASFPGDPPLDLRRVRSIGRGDPYNLSVLSMGTHTGTHIDPPSHFLPNGLGIDQVDLSLLNGPCRVIRVDSGAQSVEPADIGRVPDGTKRVLFRTSNSERWETSSDFFSDYVALGASAASALLSKGVRLVGVDSLSVERDRTGTFPVHHLLLGAGTLILEGLRLAAAPEGAYELRCLPLRIASGDGGPCRAVLIEA